MAVTLSEKTTVARQKKTSNYVYHESFPKRKDLGNLEGLEDLCDIGGDRPVIRLTRQNEYDLFLRMNYAKWKFENAVRSDYRKKWLDRAKFLESVITHHNMPLVLHQTRYWCKNVAFYDDILSEASFIMLNCINAFDAGRGFKFSTYVVRAMARTLLGKIRRLMKHNSAQLEGDYSASLDQRVQNDETSSISEMIKGELDEHQKVIIQKALCGLPPMDEEVLIRRFGFPHQEYAIYDEYGYPISQTLEEIARLPHISKTKERIRQIQMKALKHLKHLLAEHKASLV